MIRFACSCELIGPETDLARFRCEAASFTNIRCRRNRNPLNQVRYSAQALAAAYRPWYKARLS
jgi:hypothetical protein